MKSLNLLLFLSHPIFYCTKHNIYQKPGAKLFPQKIFLSCLIIFVLALVTSNKAQTVSESLKPLESFLGKTWVGKLKACLPARQAPDGSAEFTVSRKYELIFNGLAIKFSKENKELNNSGEGYFYWNDIKKQIAFFFIEGKGVFTEGLVLVENNVITIEGTMTWPKQINPDVKQSYEFKNTFEFTKDGKMIDRWYQNAFGDWREGHVIVFENATDKSN